MTRLRALPLLVLLGGLVRAFVLFASGWLVEGDEAAVGLQALGILRGERPVFYPGQAYLGNLESYLTALVFGLLGPSRYALKLVPFVFALAFLFLCWEIGRTVFDSERAGRIAALLAALPSAYVAIWSVKARGGYIEALVLSQLAWLWLWRATGREPAPHPVRAALLGGIVAGGALWINPISLLIVAPVALVAIGRLGRGTASISARLGRLLAMAAGATAGMLPLLLYRLAYGSAPFGILTGLPPLHSWRDLILLAWQYFWRDGLPAIAGLRLPKDKPFVPDWRLLAVPVYAIAIVFSLLRAPRSAAHAVLALIALAAFPIFAFGALSGENFATLIPDSGLLTRYLVPLALLFALAVGDLASRLPRVLANAGVGALLCVNLFTIFASDHAALARNEFANQPLPADYGDVIAALRSEGIRAVYANHWIGYLLTLESGEEIVSHDYTDPQYGMDRFPAYSRRVLASPDAGLVVYNPRAGPNPIDGRLRALGIGYRKRELPSFIIYYAFSPPLQPVLLDDVLQFPYY